MFLCPLRGEPAVTQLFKARPEVYKRFDLKGHNGIDFRAAVGTPLVAPISGLAECHDEGAGGYGKYVRIKGGGYDCVVAHLSKHLFSGVKEIKMGDPIGLSGNTGFSSGPHVHLGVRKIDGAGNVIASSNGYAGYLDIYQYILLWNKILGE